MQVYLPACFSLPSSAILGLRLPQGRDLPNKGIKNDNFRPGWWNFLIYDELNISGVVFFFFTCVSMSFVILWRALPIPDPMGHIRMAALCVLYRL